MIRVEHSEGASPYSEPRRGVLRVAWTSGGEAFRGPVGRGINPGERSRADNLRGWTGRRASEVASKLGPTQELGDLDVGRRSSWCGWHGETTRHGRQRHWTTRAVGLQASTNCRSQDPRRVSVDGRSDRRRTESRVTRPVCRSKSSAGMASRSFGEPVDHPHHRARYLLVQTASSVRKRLEGADQPRPVGGQYRGPQRASRSAIEPSGPVANGRS